MSSLSSAPALILLQLSSRLVTFILNQTLVRLTSPAIFGAANIQLELLLSTILFLSREGVRGALLRTESDPKQSKSSQPSGKERAKHNISLLPVPIGALISLAATYLYTSTASQTLKSQPNFVLSVSLYALGALVELCSEPLYTRAQTQMKVHLRVRAEGLAVLAKCLVTVAAVALPRISNSGSQFQEAGLIAFGLGQAAYGLVTFLVYLRAYLRTDGFKGTKSLLSLERPSGKSNLFVCSYFDPSTLDLAWVMVKQSVLKHLLTEGDKFAVAKLATLSDQGGYALASNYGSLVARMLFQPIEESSRLVFSRELGFVTSESKQNDSQPKSTIKSNSSFSNSLQSASALLSSLFKLYFVLFLFFLTFGPPLSFSLLYVVAGSKWASTSAPKILGAYCYYLPIMGLNGIAEAFLQATANAQQLSVYSKIMIFASLSFGLSLWAFSNLGLSSERRGKEVDLVWSSCISLSLRAAWSWRYILNFFKDHRDKVKEDKMKLESTSPLDCLPSTPVLLTFLVSAAVLRWSESKSSIPIVGSIRDLLPHVGAGLLCFAGCLLSCFIFERRSIVNSLSALRGSRSVQTQSNSKSK